MTTTAAKKKKKKHKPYQYDTSNYVSICPGHTVTSKRGHKALQFMLQTSGATTLKNRESAQHKAACWMLRKDKRTSVNSNHFAQRYALAVLYYMTQGDTKWNEKQHWLSTSKSECKWMGIQCNFRGHIVGLDLGFVNLTGLVPRELALLTQLKDVDLHGNELQGVLPNGVLEAWTSVEYLRLHMNGLFGQLPREIGDMSSLKELHLFGNYLQGTIPTELAKLSKLGERELVEYMYYAVCCLDWCMLTQSLLPRFPFYTNAIDRGS